MIIDKVIPITSAIIRNGEGKILLLQRSDIASYPNHWQLVEGKIDENEGPDKALEREVREEIGVSITKMDMSTPLYSEIKVKDQNYLSFRITFNVEIDSEKITLSNEHTAFGWYSKKEALTLPLLPGVKEVLEKLS